MRLFLETNAKFALDSAAKKSYFGPRQTWSFAMSLLLDFEPNSQTSAGDKQPLQGKWTDEDYCR